MASLTLIFTRSVGTLQPTRPLGRVGSKFNWPSEDQCQRSHSKWVFVFIPYLKSRVKVGNIAHMVWFAHFLFTDSAYIAHAFQCITISFYRTNVNVMSIHGVTNRPKMTTPSIVWWEGRLLFLEVVTHFWVHDPLFLWSKQLLFQFKIYVVACW